MKQTSVRSVEKVKLVGPKQQRHPVIHSKSPKFITPSHTIIVSTKKMAGKIVRFPACRWNISISYWVKNIDTF